MKILILFWELVHVDVWTGIHQGWTQAESTNLSFQETMGQH